MGILDSAHVDPRTSARVRLVRGDKSYVARAKDSKVWMRGSTSHRMKPMQYIQHAFSNISSLSHFI